MIRVENIKKAYGQLEVLKSINLSIEPRQVVCITGASGAGKTTLLQIMGSLDKPDSGSVFIGDTDLYRLSAKKLAAFRNRQIGFVFQFHYLLPEFSAIENVMMPALIGGEKTSAARDRALELLQFLGLEDRKDHKPSELSGGEQQRVAVARALVNRPQVIFADEPSGNLDTANALSLHKLFFELKENYGQTFVIVTHNQDLAAMSDRCIEMKDGAIIADRNSAIL
ncbi:MAG: ABC transporter ATP-binding protein [Bacteroides sp.]|nr:ABC transporter ATP-binding protein [Ruminococcus flavefaciens]MCM1555071.1 ABC transporter ATP-binding protein [Bacteroides sp.]MCM1555478.1 ABC transporter ATP-binding protein [Bacteroides sp.]